MSILYTVQIGDTLPYIAQRFGSTLARLAQSNNIYCPYLIYAGQKLNIPIDKNSQPINGGVTIYPLAGTNYTTVNGYAAQTPNSMDRESVEKIIGKKAQCKMVF
jgi:LysM repeat protein